MSKLIGIPIWNQGENSVGATKPYMEWAKQFGTVVLLSPDTFIPNLDLLLLPGGKDLINGNDNNFSYYNSDGERFLELFDKKTLPKYIENETPIFGICRGFQTLLRYFESNLLQHINWGHGLSKDEGDLKAHELIYTKAGNEFLKANDYHGALPKTTGSWHHQGVTVRDVSNEITVIAHAEDSKQFPQICLTEYFVHNSLPIAGVQAHSERTYYELDNFLVKYVMKLKK